MKRRRPLIGVATTALMVIVVAQLMTAATASASAPSSAGWWTQTSLVTGLTVSPDVPPDGLFVQNLFDPIAVSALSFAVPRGASADELTLNVSGTPLMLDPPVLCPATSPFEPAQGGSWSDRPSYDCEDPVRGAVSSDSKQVVFQVRGLLTGRRSSVVLLAGGLIDRIAFEKPGPDALTITGSAPPPSPGSGTGAPVPQPTFAPIPQPPPMPTLTPPPPSPTAPSPTLVAPPPNVPGGSANAGSARRQVGTMLGVALLLLSILYWSDGFGMVPLRSSIVARIQGTTP